MNAASTIYSSGTCHQECHNCDMTCTSDADFCIQRCLYETCSFECDAKRCNDGKVIIIYHSKS
ncbi:hypothetical protein P5673_023903 [Acropora cervicornis]|uniref:Uncharacterized protein n=1 Tax=Acropora cervicornis TaxID=6130 RepID=A0AAD9Q4T0_ACRCE|nr:hypothetical protein P5673_023903 [Acropora cervicornis]